MPVRPATTADAAGVAAVQVATWRVAYDGLMPAAFLAGLSVPAGTERWRGLLGSAEVRTFVAVEGDEESGEVVGFVTAGPARDADLPEGTGEVYAVYVLPSCQGRGLGRDLMGAATGWLAARGYVHAAVWVLTANAPSRSFYAALGWRPDGTERSIDVGGALVEEVRYYCELRPDAAT
jgi:ribosomal protein S18 acetylase RimI-like enzyme